LSNALIEVGGLARGLCDVRDPRVRAQVVKRHVRIDVADRIEEPIDETV
jgi:hypothetical protein